MLHRLALVSAAAVAALTLAITRPAEACGGCLAPPGENTVVEGHRMALSISKTQTVLWDQFKYSGSPKEFAWVLPVRPGTKVEISHDEFFAALEAATQPFIVAAPQSMGSSGGGGGFACGASDFSTSVPGNSQTPPVQVVNQEVVGPYEVVTLKATNANALYDWLASHGYSVPPTITPVIDAYVKEKFDFVALRLLPNKDVNAMQPVRVVMPGADATLPLRMVAAGVGAKVGIILYVIGEGRYETANFPNLAIDLTAMTWDYTANRSNYNETVEAALAKGAGNGWFTELAHPFLSRRDATRINYYGTPLPTLTEAYKTATTGGACSSKPDGGLPKIDAGGLKDASASDADLDGGDSSDGATEGGSDGGDGGASDGGGPAPCSYDDVDVATFGMYPSDVWITRLRANLPVAALGQDLKLQAAAQQTKVDGLYRIEAPPPPDRGDGCNASGSSGSLVVGFGLGALGLAALTRRRRR